MITFISKNNLRMTRIGKYNWERISQYHDGSGILMYSIYFNKERPIQFNYVEENKTLTISAPYAEDGVPVRFCCELDELESYVDSFLLANPDVDLHGTIYTMKPEEGKEILN